MESKLIGKYRITLLYSNGTWCVSTIGKYGIPEKDGSSQDKTYGRAYESYKKIIKRFIEKANEERIGFV